jgi:hypothetical protein
MICCKSCFDDEGEMIEASFIIEGESYCLKHIPMTQEEYLKYKEKEKK